MNCLLLCKWLLPCRLKWTTVGKEPTLSAVYSRTGMEEVTNHLPLSWLIAFKANKNPLGSEVRYAQGVSCGGRQYGVQKYTLTNQQSALYRCKNTCECRL